ncbi:unnamed protein product [Bursaphelenchus xylophilus]|uniref:(pine wood nematode) hypothetical protein n=1 Tax=Bursaphelenchus xylophilus TaxID=6326 RepID=A0A1I7S8V9_BURXY|nr:unnamed protein product [Bursaphelenchus xylophilus]CAG9085923.1 unnamed protein product [Bursaphelenchus xylophilus]
MFVNKFGDLNSPVANEKISVPEESSQQKVLACCNTFLGFSLLIYGSSLCLCPSFITGLLLFLAILTTGLMYTAEIEQLKIYGVPIIMQLWMLFTFTLPGVVSVIFRVLAYFWRDSFKNAHFVQAYMDVTMSFICICIALNLSYLLCFIYTDPEFKLNSAFKFLLFGVIAMLMSYEFIYRGVSASNGLKFEMQDCEYGFIKIAEIY